MPLTKPPQSFEWSLQWKTWLAKVYDWITGTEWQTPTLLNSWVDFGSTFVPARYRRVNGVVELQGLIKSGAATSGSDILVFPEGFRPAYDLMFILVSNGAMTSVQLRTSGLLELNQAANGAYLSLTGVSFKAEQ